MTQSSEVRRPSLRYSRTAFLPCLEGDVFLHVHSACLQSRSRRADRQGCEGMAGCFAIVSADGVEITRTELSTEIDGMAVWNYEHWHKSANLPSEISVSVWTSNSRGQNSLRGSVTIPCDADMNDLNEVDFILTKSSHPTGIVRFSLHLQDITDKTDGMFPAALETGGSSSQPRRSRDESNISNRSKMSKASVFSSASIGMELDHVLACTEGRNWVNSPVSLEEPQGGFERANTNLTEQVKEIKRWQVKADAGWLPWAPGVPFNGVAGEEIMFRSGPFKYKAKFESTSSGVQTNLHTEKQRELRCVSDIDSLARIESGNLECDFAEQVTNVTVNSSQSYQSTTLAPSSPSLHSLLGSWKCVETTGLETFLKQTGVNVFQRKIALAARWPSWEFLVPDDGGRLRFINHSAVGALTEDIVLNDEEYTIKDGHGNVLQCSSVWQPTKDGGILRTIRRGRMGCYSEERCVEGDRLNFVLKHGDSGPSWGRSFVRMNKK